MKYYALIIILPALRLHTGNITSNNSPPALQNLDSLKLACFAGNQNACEKLAELLSKECEQTQFKTPYGRLNCSQLLRCW